MNKEIPKILYKYVDLKGASSILFNGFLKVTPPNKFNDPFEFFPSSFCGLNKKAVLNKCLNYKYYEYFVAQGIFAGTYEQYKISMASINGLDDTMLMRLTDPDFWVGFPDHASKSIGVACLSAISDSILMWSHYGDQHRGVVIGFDSDLLSDEWIEVNYVPERFEVPFDFESDEYNLIKKLAGQKYENWKYEKEYRCIIKLPDHRKQGLYLVRYNKKAIKEVCIGWKMPVGNKISLRERILKVYSESVAVKEVGADKTEYRIVID